MRNILLTISFLGSRYHGFQIQKNAVTVQQVLQESLWKLLGHKADLKACSRTDTGVHAREFCISFITESGINEESIVKALNNNLPYDIRAINAVEKPIDFHARYDCVSKSYEYLVWNEKIMNPFLYGRALFFPHIIEENRLNEYAKMFLGKHDFFAFSGKKRTKGNTQRTVTDFAVYRTGELVKFYICADGFLHNMVRIIVGTMLSISRNKISEDDIRIALNSKIRLIESFTAPAEGLYLDRVYYE